MGFSYLCLSKSNAIHITLSTGYRYNYESTYKGDKFITVSLELPTVIAFGATGVLHRSREICFRDVQCATTLGVGSGPWHSGIILKKNVTWIVSPGPCALVLKMSLLIKILNLSSFFFPIGLNYSCGMFAFDTTELSDSQC